MNPAVTDAFALAISAADAPPAYPGVAGHEPDEARGEGARPFAVTAAMNEMRKLAPRIGSYVWEDGLSSSPTGRSSFWGDNYARLRAVKDKYDPDGLFFAPPRRRQRGLERRRLYARQTDAATDCAATRQAS